MRPPALSRVPKAALPATGCGGLRPSKLQRNALARLCPFMLRKERVGAGKSKTRGRLRVCWHQRLPPTAWHDWVGGEGPGITFALLFPPLPALSGRDHVFHIRVGLANKTKTLGGEGGCCHSSPPCGAEPPAAAAAAGSKHLLGSMGPSPALPWQSHPALSSITPQGSPDMRVGDDHKSGIALCPKEGFTALGQTSGGDAMRSAGLDGPQGFQVDSVMGGG